jgi:cobalt/nickel transport system permease protein
VLNCLSACIPPFQSVKIKKKSVAVITVSAYLSILLGAFIVALETLPIAEIPFKAFLVQMLSIHSLIGIIEVMITLTVTAFITIILSIKRNIPKTHLLYGTVAALLLVCATVLSLFASSYPDGLEWSVANVADTIPVSAVDAYFAEHSLLPDYAFKNNNSALGTSVSGLIGSIAVFALALLPAYRGFLHSKN